MKHLAALLLLSGIAFFAGAACDDDSRDAASASSEMRQAACDALASSSTTAKLVQAGESLDDRSAIDATGAPRLVMLKGTAGSLRGFVEVNVSDASLLLLVGSSVPVDVVNASGASLPMSEEETDPSWCRSASESRLWRTSNGQPSILAFGPTDASEVGVVLLRTDTIED